jgi:hypothetical protein
MTAEPKSPLSRAPSPTAASELPEEFGVPLSWPRFRVPTRFLQTRTLLFTLIVSVPVTLYFLWFYLLHYPTFTEYADPTRQYTVMLPTEPMWSGGSAGGGSDGEALRYNAWTSEMYRVRVRPLKDSMFLGIKGMNSRALAEMISHVNSPHVVRPRLDDYRVIASAQYEQWETGRRVKVGQVLVANGFVYELTVTGQGLSLEDSRVQRFFDSFRFPPP